MCRDGAAPRHCTGCGGIPSVHRVPDDVAAMRARYGLPLALGLGALASSSVLCIRAGMAVPEDLQAQAVAPHSRSAHGARGGPHPWAAESTAAHPHRSQPPGPGSATVGWATASAAATAPITRAGVLWRH